VPLLTIEGLAYRANGATIFEGLALEVRERRHVTGILQ